MVAKDAEKERDLLADEPSIFLRLLLVHFLGDLLKLTIFALPIFIWSILK
jgi:hypothetical protein